MGRFAARNWMKIRGTPVHAGHLDKSVEAAGTSARASSCGRQVQGCSGRSVRCILCLRMRLIASLLIMTGFALAAELELNIDGTTKVRYVVEAPDGIAPAGTTDPARQVGLFLCMPEHDRPTGDELMPVRESLRRLGLSG